MSNAWLDEFPTCRPRRTCEMLPFDGREPINIGTIIDGEYNYEGTALAVPNTRVTYFCTLRDGPEGKVVMIGDSVRFCEDVGLWTGVAPICMFLKDLSIDQYRDITSPSKTTTLPPM